MMAKKKKLKKNQKKALLIISVIIGIFLIWYFGFKTLSISKDCSLGKWSGGYDSLKKEFIISLNNVNAGNSGCVGSHDVRNPNIGLGVNEQDCNSFFGGYWNSDYGTCQLINEDWFKNKDYLSDFTCQHSGYPCCGAEQCGIPGGGTTCGPCCSSSQTEKYIPLFDGFNIEFEGRAWQNSDNVVCSGNILVKFKGECPIGQKKCSDGSCKSVCESNGGIGDKKNENSFIYIIIFIAIIISGGLYYVYKNGKKKRRKN